MRKKTGILLVLCMFCILTGCAKSDQIEKNSIEVSEKGTITATIHESFDREYYDKKELKETIDAAIKAYNKEAKEERISLESLRVKNEAAHAVITYAGDEDYTAFNQIGIYNGTIKDMEGLDSGEQQEIIDRDGKRIALQNLLYSEETYNLVVLQESCTLKTSGKILYASSNVTITGKKTADVTADQESYAYVVYE